MRFEKETEEQYEEFTEPAGAPSESEPEKALRMEEEPVESGPPEPEERAAAYDEAMTGGDMDEGYLDF